jgi:hypothetical protein
MLDASAIIRSTWFFDDLVLYFLPDPVNDNFGVISLWRKVFLGWLVSDEDLFGSECMLDMGWNSSLEWFVIINSS